ncbi:MAG: acyltransferase family protein [Microcoleus sp.]
MTSSRFYIPSLDGIRAAAFIMVFLSHAGINHIIPGGFGVTIFFFLSGYLITTLLRREYEQNQIINLKKFYWRRVLRIAPPFYLVLFAGAILTMLGLIEGDIQLPAFLSQALHYYNYYEFFWGPAGVTNGSGAYWSLAVEEHFYLIFPFFYISILKMRLSRKQQMWIFWGICLLMLIWRCFLVFGMGAPEKRIFHLSDTRMDSILFGSALAVNGNPALDEPYGSDRLWKYFCFPASIVLILFSLLYRNPEFDITFRYTIQGIALHCMFLAAIRFPNWGLMQVLNLNWMRFIGLLSYSLYLVHDTVLQVIYFYLPKMHIALQGLLGISISFILSYAIYVYVEKPCAKMRKQFSAVT